MEIVEMVDERIYTKVGYLETRYENLVKVEREGNIFRIEEDDIVKGKRYSLIDSQTREQMYSFDAPV